MKKGFRKPRKVRPIEKDLPKGYDSNWEYKLHTNQLKEWSHHGDKIDYTVEHTYEPDFRKTFNKVEYLIEAKGRFWDYAEYSKYIWVRKSLKEHQELVFIFAKPLAPMPAAKKRKDGSKRTHAEWAEKNNFKWYSEFDLPKQWIE
jgi:hypothetical protein